MMLAKPEMTMHQWLCVGQMPQKNLVWKQILMWVYAQWEIYLDVCESVKNRNGQKNFSTRLEQIYRYGSRSRHYLRTNLENRYIDSDSTFIMNHTFLQYTHNKEEETGWGNSLYRQHTFSGLKP